MRWFSNITSRGELKSLFRKLALQHHPDHGGNADTMREIIQEYYELENSLPEQEPAPKASKARGHKDNFPSLANPLFAHRDLCLMAKVLFIYGRLAGKCDIKIFYRKLCALIEPGHAESYRDYRADRKIAAKTLKFMRENVFPRNFKNELWLIFRKAEMELAAR